VFAKAREKARQTSCLSNVRQLSTAILSYVQDYDERFPLEIDASQPGGYWWYSYFVYDDALSWPSDGTASFNTLMPYVKNDQIFTCPSGTRDSNHFTPAPYSRNTNYTYNGWANAKGLGAAEYPAETIILWEGMGTEGIDGVVANPYIELDGANTPLVYSLWYGFDNDGDTHNEGLNYSFIDGHSKWSRTGAESSAFTATPGTAGWDVRWENFGWSRGLL
jgi:prepilin-type processing-associated H-X9-DG protein